MNTTSMEPLHGISSEQAATMSRAGMVRFRQGRTGTVWSEVPDGFTVYGSCFGMELMVHADGRAFTMMRKRDETLYGFCVREVGVWS